MANIKGLLGAAGAVALASMAMSTAVLADDGDRKFGYSITLTATSEYMFRGLSLNDEKPAFQPFIEFTYGKPSLTWYLDFWGSNTSDDVPGASGPCTSCYGPYEVDVYAGVRPVFGDLAFDFGVLYYMNPQSSTNNTDYVEFKANAQYTGIKNWNIGLTVYATPDQGINYPETETIEGNLNYTLPKFAMFDPTVGGQLGWSNDSGGTKNYFNGADNYVYWNFGVKLAADKFWIDLRYWDTDISRSETNSSPIAHSTVDSRFVGSFGVNLP